MSGAIEEIKARVDLVELVGRVVPLRKSGSYFKGLCPFHQERTPSFYVYPDNNNYVCFGCGKKGSAIDWLMEREHLEFGEALRQLAQMAGVELPNRRDPEQESATARLVDLLARAQMYYQGLLQGAAGADGRRYLAGRGLTEETLSRFGLGFAPGGNGLMRHLREGGFSEDEMVQAGVVAEADDGRRFDFFRERVIFPIRDPQGRTIAFGGRALDDGTPKYLNSRDTLLFHKQEILFALDLARKPIAQQRRAVIVEGYMDAITAHQYGHTNVVATLGTAVTERHLGLLQRLADEIVLALDSDAAGQAATWRTLQVADQSLLAGLTPRVGPNRKVRQYVPSRAAQLKVLTVPSAKDPDELIRSDGSAWITLVQAAKPVADFILDQLPRRHDLSSGRGKAEAAEEAAEVLAAIANPVEQAHYVQRAAELIGVAEAAVWQAVRRRGRGVRPSRRPGLDERESSDQASSATESAAAEPVEGNLLDEYALALFGRAHVLRNDGMLPGAGEIPPLPDEEFAAPQLRALYRSLGRVGRGSIEEVRTHVPDELRPYVERVERFTPDVERCAPEQVLLELVRVALRLQRRGLLVRKQQVHAMLREAADDEERRQWATELSQLAQRLEGLEQQLQQNDGWSRGVGER